MTLLNDILELDDEQSVFLPEESMGDLISMPVTEELVSSEMMADKAVEIIDDRQGTLGIAFHMTEPAEFWLLLTDRYSGQKIPEEFKKRLEKSVAFARVRASEQEFFEAIVEYFSTSLANELLCDNCFVEGRPLYIQDRIDRLERFLKPLIPEDSAVLEIGCGNGMATESLKRLGVRPIAIDSDRCDLCQALKSELLDPRRSFVLDARRLDKFLKPGSFDTVVGFMVGLIDDVNWSIWKDIILHSAVFARSSVLFTVYSRKEAELIATSLEDAGWEAKVIDNSDDRGVYDQFAVLGKRKTADGKVNTI